MVVGKAEQDFVGEIKFTDVLNSMCDKMADCDIPHFGLNKVKFSRIKMIYKMVMKKKIRFIISGSK